MVLPFTGLDRPVNVAVGIDGDVYVTDSGNNRVVKLAGNPNAQSVMPFTDLDRPNGVAVDASGDIYVSDANGSRMLWAVAPGSTPSPPWQAAPGGQWIGPFTALQGPMGVAIGAGQEFFVADSGNNRVLSWRSGAIPRRCCASPA